MMMVMTFEIVATITTTATTFIINTNNNNHYNFGINNSYASYDGHNYGE